MDIIISSETLLPLINTIPRLEANLINSPSFLPPLTKYKLIYILQQILTDSFKINWHWFNIQ